MFGAARHDALSRLIVESKTILIIATDRLFELRNTAGNGITRVSGLHCLDRRFANMLRRVEIRLAYAEVINRLTRALELLRLRRHGKGCRGLDALNDFRNLNRHF